MKCIECGHELKDGAVFCIRCGAMQVSVNDSANAANTAPVRPAVSSTQNAGGRHTKDFKPTPRRSTASVVVPIVAVVAVLAAVGALALFVINPGSSGQSASSQASNAQTATTTSDSSASASSSSSSSASSKSSSSASSSKSASSASASSASTSTSSSTSTSTSNSAASTSTSTSNNTSSTNNQAPAIVEPEPTYTSSDDSYYLWDTSDRYYSRGEVENLSNYDLYFARNEIYARHGRMFNNADLQNYFNSKSWYDPIYTPEQFDSMASPLSDIEQANSRLMLEVEQSRNSPYV